MGMLQFPEMMRTDTEIVTEALKLGLSIAVSTRNGGSLVVKTSRVYKNKKRSTLSCEYSLTQSILPDTIYSANKPEDIAKMAIDMAGKPVANEAIRLMANFISKNKGGIN